ncbi:MAG TPA: LTA synthase family protein [Chthoniobacterales bacterium]|nr:LTA synthase family protein [Chthoniobacterales bacterium]
MRIKDARCATEPFRELVADMVLWLALVLLFLAFRAVFFWLFRGELAERPTAQALFRCFETGLRSDTCAAMWAIVPSLILTLIGLVRPLGKWHERIRWLTIAIVLTLCAIIFITDVGYFAEYDNQFDHRIFGLVYDDLRAILTTIWKSYHVIVLVIAAGFAVATSVWGLNTICRVSTAGDVPKFLGTKWARGVNFVIVLLWLLLGARIWPHGYLVSVKNAPGAGDPFLNKIAVNPFFALRYAVWQERNMQKIAGLRTILPNGDIRSAAAALFPQAPNAATLDDCIQRAAPGNSNPPPSHVFVVVMESYDAWAMQSEYTSLHLTDRLSELGREGVRVEGFISSGSSTMESLGTIITGLPFARVLINYQPAVREGVPSAIASIFKRLGYRTRYFLGTTLSWERSGEFCREQGFDEVYGGDQMPGPSGRNEWGVDDEDLFRFVLQKTGPEPTFNLIMTSSYHPPYSVDVEKKGFDLNSLKSNPICAGLSTRQLRILGHLWYCDKCVADFAFEGERKLERPLFAFTGDHYSRKKFVSARPMRTLYEQFAVPLVLYGRKALENVHAPATLAGSHLDILPTLIDLAAPSGFVYHAFGRDLLNESQTQVGFGCNAVIGPNFIFRLHDEQRVEDLYGERVNGVDGKTLARRYRQLEALGWWRAVKGKEWPATSAGGMRSP